MTGGGRRPAGRPEGRRRRVRPGRRLRRAAAALAGAVLLFVLVRALALRAWPEAVARPDRWPDALAGTALLLREERVLVAPASGTLLPLVDDGSFVRAGQALFRMAGPGSAGDAAALADLTRQREALEREIAEHPAGSRRAETVRAVEDLVAALRQAAGSAESGAVHAELTRRWEDLRRLDDELGALRGRLEELRRRERALNAVVTAGSEVRAARPGVLEWSVDGLENALAAPGGPDPAELERWLAAAREAAAATPAAPGRPEPRDVAAGEPVGRLVDPARAVLAVLVEQDAAGPRPRAGAPVTVRVEGLPSTLDGRLVAARDAPSGRTALVLELLDGLPLLRGRVHEVQVEAGAREGLRLPADALLEDTVVVRGPGGMRLLRVRVLARRPGEVLVEGLGPGDRVARFAGWLRRLGFWPRVEEEGGADGDHAG